MGSRLFYWFQGISRDFMDMFQTVISPLIKVILVNGEEITCNFVMERSRFFGLVMLVEKNYVQKWVVLVFTYRGVDTFDLGIFDKSRAENLLKIQIVEIGNCLLYFG